MLRIFRTAASVLLLALALLTPQRAPGQDASLLIGLPALAAEAPEAALAEIDRALAALSAETAPDPRLVFDLNRLKADLLIALDRGREAAELLAELARFADRHRDVLQHDPVPLHRDAARLFEAAGVFAAAEAELAAALAEQRDGGEPAAALAETLEALAALARRAGDAAAAEAYRRQAEAAREDRADGVTRGGEGHREVEVFYATDRARTGESRPSQFYGSDRAEALELGVATVTIPESHTSGILEAPSIWRLEFSPDPARHVVLARVEPLAEDGFYTRLQAQFEVAEREAFVFVHGYNVSFAHAARRAAQIAHDMSYSGVPILFSWPSRGSSLGYAADAAAVRLSGRRLSHFLEDLLRRSGAARIHLVAHSMGSRALTDALELLSLRMQADRLAAPPFGQVLFAAPDIDAGLFRAMLPTIRPVAERLTLYASDQDWALSTSRRLHGDAPRAGEGGLRTVRAPALDSIDMSELGEDMLAHSYFAQDSSALADMLALFWWNAEPGARCGLVSRDPQPRPAPLWQYVTGVCSGNSLIELLAHLRQAHVRTRAEAHALIARVVADPDLAGRLELAVEKLLPE